METLNSNTNTITNPEHKNGLVSWKSSFWSSSQNTRLHIVIKMIMTVWVEMCNNEGVGSQEQEQPRSQFPQPPKVAYWALQCFVRLNQEHQRTRFQKVRLWCHSNIHLTHSLWREQPSKPTSFSSLKYSHEATCCTVHMYWEHKHLNQRAHV